MMTSWPGQGSEFSATGWQTSGILANCGDLLTKACARFSIREGHYVHPSRVASMGETPLSEPPKEQADVNDQPFHWGGDWYTGLAEPGAEPDPAGYLLFPVQNSECPPER